MKYKIRDLLLKPNVNQRRRRDTDTRVLINRQPSVRQPPNRQQTSKCQPFVLGGSVSVSWKPGSLSSELSRRNKKQKTATEPRSRAPLRRSWQLASRDPSADTAAAASVPTSATPQCPRQSPDKHQHVGGRVHHVRGSN